MKIKFFVPFYYFFIKSDALKNLKWMKFDKIKQKTLKIRIFRYY